MELLYIWHQHLDWITSLDCWKDWGLTLDQSINVIICALGVQIHEAPAASTDFSDILETKQLWKQDNSL